MFGLGLTMYNTEGVTLGVLSYIKTSSCPTSLLGKVAVKKQNICIQP